MSRQKTTMGPSYDAQLVYIDDIGIFRCDICNGLVHVLYIHTTNIAKQSIYTYHGEY